MGKVKTQEEKPPLKSEPESEPKRDEAEEKEEDSPVVKQLKEIDDKYLELEREYERKVQELVNDTTKRQQPLLEERKKFLSAPVENGPKTGTPILSGFWLKSMQHHPAFEDIIQEWDEPVLEFLSDIEKHSNEDDNSKGFKLTFHFLENPYFENAELTKEYLTEEGNPYCGEIEVKEIKVSTIEWKAGKDVTVERIAKKVKGGGAKKAKQKGKEKVEPRPSFFREFCRNLSAGMELPEDAKEQARSLMDPDEDDDDDEELLSYLMATDHEIGTALRDNIVPFAVRWYTGEAAPDYEKGDGDDEEEESEEEEESDDEPPPRRGAKGGGPKEGPREGPGEGQRKAAAKKGTRAEAIRSRQLTKASGDSDLD